MNTKNPSTKNLNMKNTKSPIMKNPIDFKINMIGVMTKAMNKRAKNCTRKLIHIKRNPLMIIVPSAIFL
jgi:hypothetical protein